MSYIKSPINYAGSKYRLLNQIMPLFPSDINTFVDLFGGAFNIGINVNVNKIIYNDILYHLSQLFNYWKTTSLIEINDYIDKTIIENNLSSTSKEAFINLGKSIITKKI